MLGQAAIAIWCDVDAQVRGEFDDWHAHEHMPERLSIPGFLRGTRWVAADGGPGYFILYEALGEATLSAGPYLEHLNSPTPWSRRMMPHHRNMVRSPCRVVASFGQAWGEALLTVRFSPRDPERLARRLAVELLPGLPARKGLVAAHLLRNIARPEAPQTEEQKLRGGDASADWVMLVSGYDAAAVAAIENGVPGGVVGHYRLVYVLSETRHGA
jgi:hypothetical protein